MQLFKNRAGAGKKLAQKLKKYSGKAVVVAIPRGGLEVGRAIADELKVPLDCVFSKKIPLPFEEEVAIGAVSLTSSVVNEEAVAMYGVDRNYIERKKKELSAAIKALYADYHENFAVVPLVGKTVILVDDGIATGETIEAAVLELRTKKVGKIIVAVPVGPRDALKKLEKKVDGVVCLSSPELFMAIGQFYEVFPQLSHGEAKKLLETQLFQHNADDER